MADNILKLFSTPLRQSYLSVPHRILEFVKCQEYDFHGNGATTHEYILECPEMETVKNFITKKVESYLYDTCSISDDMTIELVTSWLNLHKKGDWAQQHSHYNSVISGVWYISTTDKSGEFLVHAEQKLFGNLLDFPKRVYNEFNCGQYGFVPENGDLILFPSTLRHSVTPNQSDKDRYSLAFNYMVRGDVKSGKSTTVKL
jgi:uncharacterized protein (TIGR02466 family)